MGFGGAPLGTMILTINANKSGLQVLITSCSTALHII